MTVLIFSETNGYRILFCAIGRFIFRSDTQDWNIYKYKKKYMRQAVTHSQRLYIRLRYLVGKRVKVTPVQALRLYTGHTACSRVIALPFHDHGTGRRLGVSVTPRPLFTPGERPGTRCTGGWVGPSAGLDRCGKSRSHRVSIPGPSSPYPVAIPTELPDPPTVFGPWK